MVIRVKYISLVNLIMDSLIVKELIQQDCNPEKINEEMSLILDDKAYRGKMLDNYDKLHEKMGKPGASQKTAGLIIKYTAKK